MMKKLMVLGAGAAGYVLGARAGRERYEQIARQTRKLRNNPTVQQKVSEAADVAKHVARDAASAASDKVRGHDGVGGHAVPSTSSSQATGGATNGFGRGDEGV
jgi:hypothetical protein